MTSQLTTAQLLDLVAGHINGDLAICSKAQVKEWHEEVEQASLRGLDVSHDGNPLDYGIDDLRIVDGSDWRGVDISEMVHPDDSDTFGWIQFTGCNFAGCDLTLFRQNNRFTDCDLTGAYVVLCGRRQPAELDEDDNLI